MTKRRTRREIAEDTRRAMAYLEIKPALAKAFDQWAAATPAAANAAEVEYRSIHDQMRRAMDH